MRYGSEKDRIKRPRSPDGSHSTRHDVQNESRRPEMSSLILSSRLETNGPSTTWTAFFAQRAAFFPGLIRAAAAAVLLLWRPPTERSRLWPPGVPPQRGKEPRPLRRGCLALPPLPTGASGGCRPPPRCLGGVRRQKERRRQRSPMTTTLPEPPPAQADVAPRLKNKVMVTRRICKSLHDLSQKAVI